MPRWRKVWIREYHGKRGTTYRVCYFDAKAQARRTIRTFHSKHEARAFRNEYEGYLNGEGPKPGTQVLGRKVRTPARVWSEAVSEWVESGATRDKTRRTYRSLLQQFAEHASVICVEDVTETTISDFLCSLRHRGRSLATCAAYLRTLAAFFTWACPAGSPVTRNLINRWSPYKNRKRARPHYFTEEEYRRILSACDSISVRSANQRGPLWWKCFIAVLYHAGLRLNETAHLIWRDIDFENGILRLQPHTGLQEVFDWRPKGKARRAVPVPDEVVQFLAQMHQKQREGVPYVFLPHPRYLEIKHAGGPKSEILHGITKGFKRLCSVAGISEGTVHDMRRTCITNWAKRPELTPKDLQILAGHEDLNTTLDIYAMVEEEDVVEKMRKLIRTSNVDIPQASA